MAKEKNASGCVGEARSGRRLLWGLFLVPQGRWLFADSLLPEMVVLLKGDRLAAYTDNFCTGDSLALVHILAVYYGERRLVVVDNGSDHSLLAKMPPVDISQKGGDLAGFYRLDEAGITVGDPDVVQYITHHKVR